MTESLLKILADEQRLEALKEYNIVNTLPESEFDNITELAALICDVPIVFISFIDDKKQYFKSHFGTDIKENLIENSFCKEIIGIKDKLTVIPDTRLDNRFAENPFVTNDPSIIFYAGYQLIDSQNHFLGSLCINDTKPKKLTEREEDALRMLGQQIVKLLEDRKSKNLFQLEATKLNLERQKFEAAIQIADLGTWEWDVEHNTIKYNDNWAEMLGYKLSELEPVSFQTWVDLVHPDDLGMASEMIHKKLILGEDILNIEFRMRHKSGDYLWIRSKGDIIQKDAQGNTLKAFGTHLNINKQKIGEVYVNQIHENIDAAIFRYVQYSSGKDKLLFYTKKLNQLYNIPEDQNLDGDNVKLVWAKIYPEDIPVVQKAIENSKKKSKNFKSEWRVIHDNSSVKWLRVHGTIVLNNNEETIWDIILMDVTEEKSKTKTLQNLNERLKFAQKVSKLGYMSQNLNNDVLYWSDEIYTIMEFDHKDITPSVENYFDRIHPDDKQNVLHSKKQSEKNDSTISTEHRVILPNGDIKWVVYTSSGVTINSLGERIRECTVQDITEQKLMHLSIEESNDRFHLVGKATSDLIWDWDILNDTIIWGDNYSTNFEFIFKNLDEKKDKLLKNFMHPKDKSGVFKNLKTAFNRDKDHWQSEYRLKSNTGSWFEISNTAYILRDDSNIPVRMVGAIRDISVKKERERNLISLNKSLKIQAKQLEISNSELEQFAYVASHDLQEPLRMITSFLTLLEKKYENILDEKGKKYIHFAVDGALRMRKIILDLLDYSRVGKEHVELKMVDFNILMDEVLAIKRKAIMDTNAEITWNELPKINSYYAPLFQVFTNLISNAIKYQKPNNKPVISISCKDIETHWEFSIQDNGIGIKPQYYEKIFIIFQRLHNKEQYAGTGIGLSITKKIINNLGGNIWVEEPEKPGTLFKFTIKK